MVRRDDIIREYAHRYRAERLRVAQLVEHSTFNAGVEGSYPSAKTIHGRMAQLARRS